MPRRKASITGAGIILIMLASLISYCISSISPSKPPPVKLQAFQQPDFIYRITSYMKGEEILAFTKAGRGARRYYETDEWGMIFRLHYYPPSTRTLAVIRHNYSNYTLENPSQIFPMQTYCITSNQHSYGVQIYKIISGPLSGFYVSMHDDLSNIEFMTEDVAKDINPSCVRQN